MGKIKRAEALLEILNANGIDTIFINPGLDTTPVQSAVLKYTSSGKRSPNLILNLDESVAMSAAHGNYMVTGKPQVVMVHAELGTLQVGGALHNAQWGRVPLLFLAASPGDKQRLTWMQKPYDQGSIVRNSVKWDHWTSPGEDFYEIFQKALQTACAEPAGPVYLTYPVNYLSEEIEEQTVKTVISQTATPLSKNDVSGLNNLYEILIAAERPLILAGFSGRHAESVDNLVTLAESLSIPVLTGPNRMNFPTNHPLCAGIEKGPSNRKNRYLTDADVVLLIDYDMPYVPAFEAPKQDAKILGIGADSSTQGRLAWGRGPEPFVKADTRAAIPALTEMIKKKISPEKSSFYAERFRRLEKAHKDAQKECEALALQAAEHEPISPDWLCKCINDTVTEDTIIVNHVISDFESVAEQLHRTKPGTLISCPGGSISWALGASLGAKLGAPDKTVVSLITDGGFVWGCPVATFWAARSHHAPFLSIVF
ncbi:MAG TPA: thiamine pyrophosphate-binding protein, partial [Dehalococcoidales bacterium]|nr:thiamine pyrophosphate-binding protein [Dehalococcoidales bacterium]